jgi:hypothetical protein
MTPKSDITKRAPDRQQTSNCHDFVTRPFHIEACCSTAPEPYPAS